MSWRRIALAAAGVVAGAIVVVALVPDDGARPAVNDQSLSFSRDGDALAFASDRAGNGKISAIYAGRAREAPRRVTRSGRSEAFPALSPDGSRIVFARSRPDDTASLGSRFTLYVVDVDGSGARRLTNRDDWSPAWSPDGKTVVFVRGQDDLGIVTNLHSIGADGRGAQLLLRHATDPAWSPDGTRIAFVSESRERVAVLDRRTGKVETVVRAKSVASNPAWSPDGQRIAFDDVPDDARVDLGYGICCGEVYVVNADGTALRRLTRNKDSDGSAVWTADGRIVFESDRDGPTRFYVVNANGTRIRRFMPARYLEARG